MDALDQWFRDYTQTPTGSVLLFLLVIFSRLVVDELMRRRARNKKKPRRPRTDG